MAGSKMQFNLTGRDKETIKEAIGRAEKNTSGEIVTAIIKESSDYAFYELLTAIIGGFLTYLISIYFYAEIAQWLEGLFWDYTDIYTATFLGGAVILSTGTIYLLVNVPGIDRFIVPGKIITRRVNQRAKGHFLEAGLSNTRDRTGILIFISYREKRIELLADSGISSLIPEEKWKGIVNDLIVEIKKKKIGEGIVKAVEECGELLSEHFPIKSDDTNELPNDINILED
jgi:putative membrane protein